jgi:ABC-2 type transport system ATP-binding protein
MSTQKELINNALSYFKRKDFSLGYRTLLDTALNTNSEEIFSTTLAFVEKYESIIDSEKNNLLSDFESCLKAIEKLEVLEEQNRNKIILEGENIVKDYNNGRFVLGPIDVNLKKGNIYGLVGENGNGKTTLLTILASITKYNSGKLSYYFSGNKKDNYETLSRLVYIPQRTAVWYGKVLDNLKFALVHHNIKKEKNDLLVLMMVARFGLWKYKDLKWQELSSGYKMRFELARTLLRKPEIVLLDEPLANLDILAQQIILEDLKMLAKSPVNPIAMIFSSQQLYEVEKISDSVIYLRNGKPTKPNLKEENSQLVVELDTENTREEIEELFVDSFLNKIEFNGGVYILYFSESFSFNQVLQKIANSNLVVIYIRDISKSTRRFFIY